MGGFASPVKGGATYCIVSAKSMLYSRIELMPSLLLNAS